MGRSDVGLNVQHGLRTTLKNPAQPTLNDQALLRQNTSESLGIRVPNVGHRSERKTMARKVKNSRKKELSQEQQRASSPPEESHPSGHAFCVQAELLLARMMVKEFGRRGRR